MLSVTICCRLRNALQAKAAAKQSCANGEVSHGSHSHLCNEAAKKQRHIRRKRPEKHQAPPNFDEYSKEDFNLLERWQKMQRESERKRLESQLGDIITKTLVSPSEQEKRSAGSGKIGQLF